MRTPMTRSPRRSGLLPAALLGLLGLPLIIDAGAASKLPEWVYGSSLYLAIILGTLTIMRTSRIERFAALVATVLLAGLCLVQLTGTRLSYGRAEPAPSARSARVTTEADQTRFQVEKNALPPHEENTR